MTSTNGNSGLFLLMHSQPWRSVGLHTVVSMVIKKECCQLDLIAFFIDLQKYRVKRMQQMQNNWIFSKVVQSLMKLHS